jgi:hypothetical protein
MGGLIGGAVGAMFGGIPAFFFAAIGTTLAGAYAAEHNPSCRSVGYSAEP